MIFFSSLRTFSNLANQFKTVHRCFSRSGFPLNASSIVSAKLNHVSPHLNTFLKGYEEGFAQSFKYVLQCCEEQDLSSLAAVCDFRLCRNFKLGFESLGALNQKMKIVNEESEIQLDFFNEEFEWQLPEIFKTLPYAMESFELITKSSRLIPIEKIKICNGDAWIKLKLSVDVRIKTTMKVRTDDSQDGDDDTEETHLFRFNTEKKYERDQVFSPIIGPYSFLRFGRRIFKNCQWKIIDIDQSLQD